jgi:hypothetical protein
VMKRVSALVYLMHHCNESLQVCIKCALRKSHKLDIIPFSLRKVAFLPENKTLDYRVFGLRPSSGILKNRKFRKLNLIQ